MISVLMETRDQEEPLARSLSALVPGAIEGLVREVLIIDCGSRDGSAQVAEAAGCRFFDGEPVADVIAAARSGWLFLMEPGARPSNDWIDRLGDHMATCRKPARLTDERRGAFGWLRTVVSRGGALRHGLLIRKDQVSAGLPPGARLEDIARGLHPRRLSGRIAPAPRHRP